MESIGKYEILEKIGVGGFGVVYKGYDPFIKRHVAIKACSSDDEEIRQRFYREAEIAGNLQHRNIVTVYEFGIHDGVPFLVQEYLSGEDLDRKIKRRDFMPFPQKLLYLIQIVRGLEFAHGRGVIHRDIKPANVRILEDDTTKIMDFGIAKLAQGHSGLTQEGITLGTATYLAPEQIRGDGIDPRTDIFSFGVLAYELLTLERPFAGQHISTIFFRILNEQPRSITDFWQECPDDLAQIIYRCLEKNPGKRYPSCTELLQDLEALVKRRRGGESEQTRPHPTQEHQPPHAGSAVLTPLGVSGASTSGVGDLELDYPTHLHGDRRTPTYGLTTTAFQRQRRGWGKWLSGALVLLAIGGGLWYYQQTAPKLTPWVPSGASNNPSASSLPSPSPFSPESQRAQASAPTTATSLPTTAPTQPGAADSPAAQQAAAVTPATETNPEPPPPPPPPPPAKLILQEAWNPEMTVRVGRKEYRLDRRRILELSPGSYRLRFALTLPDYQDEREVSVQLKGGEEQTLPAPLGRPGFLSIRPHLNTPQGFATAAGKALGKTPLQRLKLPPKTYVVEILSGVGPGETPKVHTSVEVKPETETVLTFDLSGQLPTRVAEKPAEG